MSDPFLGEIRMMSFGYAPTNWAQCNGQLLPINQYAALFSLLGTQFGGNGSSNFALPNLQGGVPMHRFTLTGGKGGQETVTLTTNQMPAHSHSLLAKNAPADTGSGGFIPDPTKALARASAAVQNGSNVAANIYGTGGRTLTFSSGSVSTVGGTPHENRQPYLAINFCIALNGIYPSRD